jgi:ComF family protein
MKRNTKIKSIFHDIHEISTEFLLDIFFPKFCVGCGKYDNYVCEKCVKEIEIMRTATCPDCGKISPLGKFCPNCKKKLGLVLSGIIVAANYESGPTREMIHHLKYSGFNELSELLGELIVQRLSFESLSDDVILVPVPLHINKQTKRGFNQSELIAQYVSNRTKIPFKNALLRIRQTESQVGLSGDERRSNLEGAFQCNKKSSVAGKTIFLVDDVTTTYSTLNECAKELKSSGAKKVYGLVVAKG